MAAQATADVVALQKEAIAFSGKLPVLFAKQDVFVNQIQARKNVKKVSSRELRVPQKLRPGARVGAVNLAGGALGRGTASKYGKAAITPIASRIAVEIQLDALNQTDGGEKSVKELLAEEVAAAMEEFRIAHNTYLQTAGDGVMATLSATPGGTTFTFASAPFYTQLLREGAKYSVYDTTLATKRGEVECVSLDHQSNQGVFDSNLGGTVVNTDKLLPEGLSGATPAWYFGIPYHHNSSATGTWEGYSRASEPNIRANRVDGGGNALTTSPIRLALSKLLQRVGKVDPKSLKAHLHPAQKTAYEELGILISEFQKGGGNETFDALFGDMKMAGVSLEVDTHAARDRIDFVNLNTWGKAESMKVDFIKNPHGHYYTWPTDATTGSPLAAILFHIAWFGQYFTDMPAGLAYIDNLAIPTGFTAM